MENNIEDLFGKSLKNPFETDTYYDRDAEELALKEAEDLLLYLEVSILKLKTNKKLTVSTKKTEYEFYVCTYSYLNRKSEECMVDFSVPLTFKGPVRIWAENSVGQKVWTTVGKIYQSKCDVEVLFNFLGKYFDRITELEADLLPFTK